MGLLTYKFINSFPYSLIYSSTHNLKEEIMSIYENNISGEGKSTSELVDLNEFIPLHKPKKSKLRQDSDEIYKNNIEALGKHHPELVELIESINIDDDQINVLYSESDDPRILYKKEDGEEIYIHNAKDPTECANQAIDLLGKIEKEGIVVLFGFGLGYFAEEVLKNFENGHILMAYEATPALFKTALKTRDLSNLLESEKVKIIIGEDADNFSVVHSHHHLIANGKFWIVQHKPSIRLNENAYENFYKRLNEEKRISDTGVNTIVGRGKEFIDAFLMNIPSIIRKPGVSKLKDIFKGRPAIIVSAGPSLDKNKHLLKKAKGKAIIIAVGGAIPALLTCNIIPDIAVEIDPIEENVANKFKDNPLLKDIPLIPLAQYTPEAINIYPGPLFINSVPQNIAYQWLASMWENKGYIECFGGSVAHLAFGVAEFIGADNIAFIGQDLSYSGKRAHTKGYTDRLDISVEEAGQKGLKGMPGAIPTADIFNEKVFTIPQFLTFKTSFENRIKKLKGKVVNATEGGLSIEGAPNMRFVDFIDEYCSRLPEIDTFSIISGSLEESVSYNLEGLINKTSVTRKKFMEIRKTSKRILKFIKRLKTLNKKGKKDSTEFHNILKKVGSLIERVKHPLLNLIAGYHYGFELYLKKQEVQEIDDIEDKWERLEKQLERGQNYYSEIVKAIGLFNKQVDKLIADLEREKRVDSILSDESLEEKERFFKVGMIYKRAGMVAQAVKYLEAVMRDELCVMGDGSRVTENEAVMGVTDHASRITHHGSSAAYYGLAHTYLAMDASEKAVSTLEKAIDIDPKNPILYRDMGIIAIQNNDFASAEIFLTKAIELAPQVEELYKLLSNLYINQGETQKAISLYEDALLVNADNPVIQQDLAMFYKEMIAKNGSPGASPQLE